MKKITKAILTGAVIAGMFMAGGCNNSSSGSSSPKTNERYFSIRWQKD